MATLYFCLLALFSVAFAEVSYIFSNQFSFLKRDCKVLYNFNASSDTLEFLRLYAAFIRVSFQMYKQVYPCLKGFLSGCYIPLRSVLT